MSLPPEPSVPSAGPVRAALGRLPGGPGVYRFRDAGGRALYLGRAVNLRRRVASYWGDLADRPRAAAMVPLIARVEAVECASEHEAAWLERNLLEHELLPFNRTAGGQEVEVYLRLDTSGRSPGLRVVHEPRPAGCARSFGPYLGGLRVRLAAAGLQRVLPLDYAVESGGSAHELGRRRGGRPADRDALAAAIGAVLRREPDAVAAIRTELTARRDAAAQAEAFEVAGRIQDEMAGVDWVVATQRVAVAAADDAVACGWADGVLCRFEIRSGRVREWHQVYRSQPEAVPLLADTPPEWRDFATQTARLAARLNS